LTVPGIFGRRKRESPGSDRADNDASRRASDQRAREQAIENEARRQASDEAARRQASENEAHHRTQE